MRLDKFLSNYAGVSRSEGKRLIKAGLVAVNDAVVRSGEHKLVPETDMVVLDGKTIKYSKDVCLLLNKPSGYVCSKDSSEGIPVCSLAPDFPTVFPAGRLDKDTEGMLILTDNGEIAHRLITPAKRVTKYYIAQLESEYDPIYAQLFREGIVLNGERCLPAEICPLRGGKYALIELCEGKYHQVRRMLKAVGNHVLHLRRIQIGQLIMPSELLVGTYMEIMPNDVEKMLKPDSFDFVSYRVNAEFSSL